MQAAFRNTSPHCCRLLPCPVRSWWHARAAASTTAPRSPDTEWQYDYDVLIAGGGVVGAALGCKLAAAGTLRIGLVEARPPGPAEGALKKEVPDARVYALTPASKRLLDEIGVWNAVAQRTQPFDSVQVGSLPGSLQLRMRTL
ncbi:unnamed protein product [Phaeothamnion confervicola]